MPAPWAFDTQVQVQTVTKTYDGLGTTETFTNGDLLFACVCEPTKNMYMHVNIVDQQRFNKTTIYRLIVRNKQNFSYSDTRFLWTTPNDGVHILKPFENQRLEGSRHTAYTSMLVEDITDLQSKPV